MFLIHIIGCDNWMKPFWKRSPNMSMLILLLSFIWFLSAISNKPLLSANHCTNHISISYILYIYYQSNPNQKNDKTYNISKISHCFNCFVICFLSNCASFSDLYQFYLFWVSKFLYLWFIVVLHRFHPVHLLGDFWTWTTFTWSGFRYGWQCLSLTYWPCFCLYSISMTWFTMLSILFGT